MKKTILSIGLAVAALLPTSCQKNDYGTIDLSGYQPEPEVTLNYVHPCALYTKADFERVKAAISAGTLSKESKEEFENLKQNRYVIGDYGVTPHVHEQIVRGDPTGTKEGVQNYGDAMKDAASAYQFGLLYLITGNDEYARKGVTILNAWAKGCKEVTANDNNFYLAAGCQGFTFALAGEELRSWSGWSETEFTEFKNWMLNVFADKNYKFLQLHGNSTCGSPKHYMSNWDLVNLCSYLQIGILCEDDEIVNYVADYFTKTGTGLGSLPNIVQKTYDFTCPDGTIEKVAQAQESGRDQGHATMAIVVAGQLAQAAWALYQDNPEAKYLDFFSSNDNALLHMAEYSALANLKDGKHEDLTVVDGQVIQGGNWLYAESQIPFTPVGKWCSNSSHEAGKMQNTFSGLYRGQMRPGYEIYWNHYKNTAGSYFIKRYAEVLRPEGGSGDERYGQNSGAFDQIGWGTLMLYNK